MAMARIYGTQYLKKRRNVRNGAAATTNGALRAAVTAVHKGLADWVCIYKRSSGVEMFHIHARGRSIHITQVR